MDSKFNSKVDCPDCGTPILINTEELLLGHKFTCHNCHITIGLSSDSRVIVEDTIKKLETLKIKKIT